ncbi:MAG: DUF3516 domain-containing protein, partial [Myxococcota bacterium]
MDFVNWNEQTFTQLQERQPEPLDSRFSVTHSMLLHAIQSYGTLKGGGYARVIQLIGRSHGGEREQRAQRRHTRALFKSLRRAEIVSIVRNRLKGNRVIIDDELQRVVLRGRIQHLEGLHQVQGERG